MQTAKQIGAQYFDYTNQRTAFLGPDGSGIVTLIKEGKEFQVDSSKHSFAPQYSRSLTSRP